MFDEQYDGSTIRLLWGESFVIALGANPSTGFSWQVLEIDVTILEKTGDHEFMPNPEGEISPGAGGRQLLTFRAISTGTTTLRLAYKQPWDEQAKPAKTFTIEVVIV